MQSTSFAAARRISRRASAYAPSTSMSTFTRINNACVHSAKNAGMSASSSSTSPLLRQCLSVLGSRAAFSSSSSSSFDIVDPLLGLTDSQSEYYQAALEFAAAELTPHAAEWDETKFFPEKTLQKAASMGFGTMYVRPEFGGSGLTRGEGLAIVEALAGGCTSTTAYLTIHNMCAWMIDTYGNDEQRSTWLPKMSTMEVFSSYCLTEPNAGSDAASLSTKATFDASTNSYVLNGSKAFISGGGRSDLYIVMARTGSPTSGASGISTFLVPSTTQGIGFGKQEKKMGWNTQPTAAVFFQDCRIPAGNRIGNEGEGFKYAMSGLDGGRLSIAACSLGAATTCLQLSRDYVKQRKQFGAPLAANQSIGFTISKMATDLVLARSAVRTAAAMLDAKHPAARSYCALAKKVATEKGFGICNSALQLHGGYGYLKDYPLERFVRDTRVHMILEGTNEIMDVILSRQLLAHK